MGPRREALGAPDIGAEGFGEAEETADATLDRVQQASDGVSEGIDRARDASPAMASSEPETIPTGTPVTGAATPSASNALA